VEKKVDQESTVPNFISSFPAPKGGEKEEKGGTFEKNPDSHTFLHSFPNLAPMRKKGETDKNLLPSI